MTENDSRVIIETYIKRIFGFMSNRVSNYEDVNDLTQDVCIKIYEAMSRGKEISNLEHYIWTIAHNVLSNYYRDNSKYKMQTDISNYSETMSDDKSGALDKIIKDENEERLRHEIAYLSKSQRQVVIMHYYEGRKQSEIAEILDIPVGTVKWYLSRAKEELKKGMERMRVHSELKFNPIRFHEIIGMNGSIGTMGTPDKFLNNLIDQNILYCAYKDWKTVEEIADSLGISPVFIESQVERLVDMGVLLNKDKRFIANILISESGVDFWYERDKIYKEAAKILVDELQESLNVSEILKNDGIYNPYDNNFAMWSLIPYIVANSAVETETKIKFEDVATERPDGGKNIISAAIVSSEEEKAMKELGLSETWGPCWSVDNGLKIWILDSFWTEERIKNILGMERKLYELPNMFNAGKELYPDDMALLVEKGFVKREEDGSFSCATIKIDVEIENELIRIGNECRKKVDKEISVLRKQVQNLMLEGVPTHLKDMAKFNNQSIFNSEGIFIWYIGDYLVKSGKLELPNEEQRRSACIVQVEG